MLAVCRFSRLFCSIASGFCVGFYRTRAGLRGTGAFATASNATSTSLYGETTVANRETWENPRRGTVLPAGRVMLDSDLCANDSPSVAVDLCESPSWCRWHLAPGFFPPIECLCRPILFLLSPLETEPPCELRLTSSLPLPSVSWSPRFAVPQCLPLQPPWHSPRKRPSRLSVCGKTRCVPLHSPTRGW